MATRRSRSSPSSARPTSTPPPSCARRSRRRSTAGLRGARDRSQRGDVHRLDDAGRAARRAEAAAAVRRPSAIVCRRPAHPPDLRDHAARPRLRAARDARGGARGGRPDLGDADLGHGVGRPRDGDCIVVEFPRDGYRSVGEARARRARARGSSSPSIASRTCCWRSRACSCRTRRRDGDARDGHGPTGSRTARALRRSAARRSRGCARADAARRRGHRGATPSGAGPRRAPASSAHDRSAATTELTVRPRRRPQRPARGVPRRRRAARATHRRALPPARAQPRLALRGPRRAVRGPRPGRLDRPAARDRALRHGTRRPVRDLRGADDRRRDPAALPRPHLGAARPAADEGAEPPADPHDRDRDRRPRARADDRGAAQA